MIQRKVKFWELVNWTSKQKEADSLVKLYKYILYGGAMGGGKSYWLRWELIKLLMYYFVHYGLRNVTVGLFCEDYPALKDRHLAKIKFEFPEWLGEYHAQDHNFVLGPEYGGGILAFRNLDDVTKYQSSEFAAEGVDEITKNKKEVFDFLRTRLRWPGIEDTKFIAGTNPGGIGHLWVKKLWMESIFEPGEKEKERFKFIRAIAKDNPHLPESYYTSLEGLPEKMKRAFVEGDWDVFEGQYFTEWRADIHVIEPFKIHPGWTRFVCGDYGYSKPSAIYWCAVDYDGNIYVYRELYGSGMTFKDLAKTIFQFTPRDEYINYWVFDPSIWNKRGESELSGAEMMYQVAAELKQTIEIVKGNNDRVNGWRVMREYLKPYQREGKTIAKIQFFKTCVHAIQSIPSLVYDSIRPEDLDSGGEDHAADSIRYGMMSRPLPHEKPLEKKTDKQNQWEAVDKDLERIRSGGETGDEIWDEI